MASDGSIDAGFYPPSRRITYPHAHDNDFEAYTPQRTTTSNLEAQFSPQDQQNDFRTNEMPPPTNQPYQGLEGTYPQQSNNTYDQPQQYYAAMDPSAPQDSQAKTVFPPLPLRTIRKRFNKHIMIPSVIAVVLVVLVVTLIVCYVAGAFEG